MLNLLSVDDLTNDNIIEILDEATRYKQDPRRHDLGGYTMTNIFMEPSTRTTLSFQKAMLNLGGNVLQLDMDSSSVRKGETLYDTLRTAAVLSDIIVLRQPDILPTTLRQSVPVINAGDGSGEHPTQALLDLYTIRESIGRITDLDVVFVGDNENSRTVHSLVKLLNRFKDNRLVFIEPSEDGQAMLEKVIHTANVVYMTRHQKERHHDTDDYYLIKMDEKLMKKMNANAILMHPLPRNAELPEALDKDERSVYFEQVRNGVFVRMAVLARLLLQKKKNYSMN
jgi:aspartate carbamoyltransferase